MSTVKMKAKKIRNPKWKYKSGLPYCLYITEDGRAFVYAYWGDLGETEQQYLVKVTNQFHGEEYRYEIFPVDPKGLVGERTRSTRFVRPYKIRP